MFILCEIQWTPFSRKCNIKCKVRWNKKQGIREKKLKQYSWAKPGSQKSAMFCHVGQLVSRANVLHLFITNAFLLSKILKALFMKKEKSL